MLGLNGWRIRRARAWVSGTLWVIPALYVMAATALSFALVAWDASSPLTTSLDLSTASATAALSAVGAGMITFTGFVTSVVLLVVQFGSSQFSPRFLRWFRNDPVVKHALGTFMATFVFALLATALSGRGADDLTPYRSLFVTFALLLASIGWFLALISNTSNNLRVAHVTQRLDERARKVFDVVYPIDEAEQAAAARTLAEVEHRTPIQHLRRDGAGAVLVAIDRRALLSLAVRHDVVIEVRAAVGDHVAAAGLVLDVYGDREVPVRALRSALWFGDERTIEDDPAFSLRLLVDLAIKALSPAVNDPTTAVQSLHRIEDVLRYAAGKHLSTGVVRDPAGAVRVLVPTPTWEDLVALGLDEIRISGGGQYQIARRLRALLLDLHADLPPGRRPALDRQLALLDDEVDRCFPDGQRDDALVPDRQGLGLGRPDLG